MDRAQYLTAATSWTHHTPFAEQPRTRVPCPYEGYEQYPGWQIIIMPTTVCNAGCKHCYLRNSSSLDPDQLMEMIKNFQSQGYNVYLNGSEPLANPDYLKAFKLADQKIAMTNGEIIYENPPYIYQIADAGIKTLGISYHFDMHKEWSKIPLRLAETALSIAQNAGINARVMTTITKPFIEKIPQYCSWCVERGYPEIRFTNFMSQGRAQTLDRQLILDADDRKRYYEIISEQREKYPIDVLRISSCGSFGACGTPNFSCMAMRDFVVLTPDLKVYPCFFQIEKGMECGVYENGHIFTKIGYTQPQNDCSALRLYNTF